MSRRQHVVRTDDQAGVGSPRSLGGCQIYCASESPGPTMTVNSGSLAQGDEVLIAPIAVVASQDYQRCVISAVVGQVSAYVPDPGRA
jgi:hypothetical protein